MSEITAKEAVRKFSDIIGRVEYGGEWVVVTRHGKPCVACVSLEDLERLKKLKQRRS